MASKIPRTTPCPYVQSDQVGESTARTLTESEEWLNASLSFLRSKVSMVSLSVLLSFILAAIRYIQWGLSS